MLSHPRRAPLAHLDSSQLATTQHTDSKRQLVPSLTPPIPPIPLMVSSHARPNTTADALAAARPDGVVAEFGVFHGKSIRLLAEMVGPQTPIDGFDTFEGIPEVGGSLARGRGRGRGHGRVDLGTSFAVREAFQHPPSTHRPTQTEGGEN